MLLKEYEDILKTLVGSGWNICGVERFLNSPDNKSVMLRHDVDRRPKKAVSMARLEYKYGVSSTYYFRADKNNNYSIWAIKLISNLGHEVGYHYETLSKCHGDKNKAIILFKDNLQKLRQIANCKTISMHGSPLSKFNNQELFKNNNLAEFGLLGDAVLNISKYKPLYFTDVGGKWNHTSVNLRDIVPGSRVTRKYKSLSEDIGLLLDNETGPIYINAHPERWAEGFFDRIYCLSLDTFLNIVKRFIKLIHRRPSVL